MADFDFPLTCRCGSAAKYLEIGISSRIYALCASCQHTYNRIYSFELTSDIGVFLISSMVTAKLSNSDLYHVGPRFGESFYVDRDELESFTSRLGEKIF